MRLTSKQEMFARELAKGTNQYKSFCIAYPLQGKNSKRETIDSHASRLANSDKVTARVEKLQEKALNHVKYDIEAHFNELIEAAELSKVPMGKDGNIDVKAFIKAVELKGKVKGHYITRVEQGTYDMNLKPEEEEILRAEAKELGLTWEEYCEREGLS